MAAALAGPAVAAVERQAEAFGQDPVGYIVNVLLEWGSGLLILGTLMGAAGFMGQTWAQKELNSSGQAGANLFNVFNNLQNPATPITSASYLSITTPNPLQDVENAAANAWTFVSGVGKAVGTTFTDIFTAIQDVLKLVVNVVTQGPPIALHLLGGIVVDGISLVLIFVFPYFIILGGFLVLLGTVLWLAKWTWDSYLAPTLQDWATQKIAQPVDQWLRELLDLPVRKAPTSAPVVVAPTTAVQVGPEPSPSPAPAPPLPSPPPAPEAPKKETLVAVPTEAVQASLGTSLQEAKDRFRAAMRARDEAPGQRERRRTSDLVSWLYAQPGGVAEA